MSQWISEWLIVWDFLFISAICCFSHLLYPTYLPTYLLWWMWWWWWCWWVQSWRRYWWCWFQLRLLCTTWMVLSMTHSTTWEPGSLLSSSSKFTFFFFRSRNKAGLSDASNIIYLHTTGNILPINNKDHDEWDWCTPLYHRQIRTRTYMHRYKLEMEALFYY